VLGSAQPARAKSSAGLGEPTSQELVMLADHGVCRVKAVIATLRR
jgi:hypothetical protein